MAKTKKITIIDYELWNLFSIYQASKFLWLDPVITSDAKLISESEVIILPWVWSFWDAMSNLERLGLIEVILKHAKTWKFLLWICLWLQLLLTKSFEFWEHKGLDIIKWTVNKFDSDIDGDKIRVPHMWWNQISFAWNENQTKNWFDVSNLNWEYMYFVHSFFVCPDDKSSVLTNTNYWWQDFCSSISYNNIIATQFHPEKSGKKWLDFYNNIINFIYK